MHGTAMRPLAMSSSSPTYGHPPSMGFPGQGYHAGLPTTSFLEGGPMGYPGMTQSPSAQQSYQQQSFMETGPMLHGAYGLQQQNGFDPRGFKSPHSQQELGAPGFYGGGGGSAQSPYMDNGTYGSAQALAAAPTMQLGSMAPTGTRKTECQEEFAEDQCLEGHECGNDTTEPKPEHLFLGIDTRPLLPIALALSTVLGGLWMVLFQVPLISRLLDVSQVVLSAFFCTLYLVTLGTMAYAALFDPGQMRPDKNSKQGQALMSSESFGSQTNSEPPLPKRAHKSWQYKRPIRRYDHYCRWLTNGIGLLNHREFLVMVFGLVLIGIVGTAVDVLLAVSMVHKGFWINEVLIAMHMLYSVIILWLAGPIFRIHFGLVSRNELATEWRRNDFYIAVKCKKGENIPVNDLSDEEFNELFDNFKYDKKKNSFDRGCLKNCFMFWCTPRWRRDQLGEF